jgi:hypothetical protein
MKMREIPGREEQRQKLISTFKAALAEGGLEPRDAKMVEVLIDMFERDDDGDVVLTQEQLADVTRFIGREDGRRQKVEAAAWTKEQEQALKHVIEYLSEDIGEREDYENQHQDGESVDDHIYRDVLVLRGLGWKA